MKVELLAKARPDTPPKASTSKDTEVIAEVERHKLTFLTTVPEPLRSVDEVARAVLFVEPA